MRLRAHGVKAVTLGVVVLVGAAGCGGGAGKPARGAATSTTSTASVDPETSDKPTNGGVPADAATEAEVRRLGGLFINAFVRHDAEGFCATLAPVVRQALARRTGSCEDGADRLFPTAETAGYMGARVLDVRLLDGYAYASIEARDGEVLTAEDGLVARRVGGRWRLTLPTRDPVRPHLSAADVREIRATTNRYLAALRTRRWSVACEARTQDGRNRLAAAGGGRCEDGVKAAATGNGTLRSLRAGSVALVDDGKATVEIVHGDDEGGYEDLDVQRIADQWLLAGATSGNNTYNLP